jgi:hypothetical protein
MTGGTISTNKATSEGGGVYNSNSSTFKMLDGIISGNEAISSSGGGAGGGVYNSHSMFEMSGGEISDNHTGPDGSGGGVFNLDGVFDMSIGKISGNSALYGGGVHNYCLSIATTTFTMSSGEISGNTADFMGGGVYNTSQNTAHIAIFNMDGGIISGNKAT